MIPKLLSTKQNRVQPITKEQLWFFGENGFNSELESMNDEVFEEENDEAAEAEIHGWNGQGR